MYIRGYIESDCVQLAKLFYDTVHFINKKDYTKNQLDAWASGNVDIEKWNKSFLEHYTLVAIKDDIIVGFGDIDSTGYLDRLYVHKNYQGVGIATALCDKLEKAFNVKNITTYSSITAKPFFEKRGYKVIKEQEVERMGINLINYIMEK
ncbi:hypothetical protein HMPREF1092_02133 [Clostridium thermobutyricum]|uniref:N-acetyltransferase domain-containing protein n=1 Tax=Clostridium thermobutyricum TaxID=29372 RepID=N9XYH0_9CLOT|nr:GNAT family N-acetyltransferase [Clostridium thermobutyricum]ENZ00969.1 hypothetical protein HMPREF1092_02133 [Clostridium thermobutyricum]